MKSVVADPGRYDWEGDAPLRRPFVETVIYELHVRGFTRHPSSGLSPATRGTYAGLIEKIPYLKDLGVTAVELLPVFQFDPRMRRPAASTTGAISRSRSSRRITRTARGRTRSASSTNSATWSRRCIAPASRSFSTSSSITPRKADATGRRSAIAAWPTTSITSSRTTSRTTPTTPDAATRSTPTIRSCAG